MDAGFCTVGVFGSEALRNYTAVGTPATLATLLQEDAAPGGIVCGATTFRLVEERVGGVPRGARELQCRSRPGRCRASAISPSCLGKARR